MSERDWTQDHYVTRNSTTDDPSGYRVWLTCRCGWNSGTLPDGNLPTTHRAELEHYVSGAPAEPAAPPAYLALDLWQALNLPVSEFDAYFERNRWADTWANLLDRVRRLAGRKECPVMVDGEGCELMNGHSGPHMGASDVGASEPLPAEPAVTEEMVGRALLGYFPEVEGQPELQDWGANTRKRMRAALVAALSTERGET